MKNKLYKFYIRLSQACRILIGNRAWVLMEISDNDMLMLLKGDDYEISITYHALREYPARLIIKHVAENTTDIDMALLKAQFEAGAETYISIELNENSQHI